MTPRHVTLISTLQAIAVCAWALWTDYLADRAMARRCRLRAPLRERIARRLLAWEARAFWAVAAAALIAVIVDVTTWRP